MKQNKIRIAGLQEEMARKAKIAKKELQMAQASNSCGSSFRSVSPVGTLAENLAKVSEWMDKTEEAENLALSIDVPLGHQQTSVSAADITVQSTHGGQCTAQARDLKPAVKQTISTEFAKRCFGMIEQRLP